MAVPIATAVAVRASPATAPRPPARANRSPSRITRPPARTCARRGR
jgi:hypothetical protein